MKKIISLKEIIILSVTMAIVSISTLVFATDISILADNNTVLNNTTNVEDLGASPVNITTNNTVNTSTGTNSTPVYNTVDKDNKDDLPQTGIEDYNIGILLIICVGASIYTYKKMRDYKNI